MMRDLEIEFLEFKINMQEISNLLIKLKVILLMLLYSGNNIKI